MGCEGMAPVGLAWCDQQEVARRPRDQIVSRTAAEIAGIAGNRR
jgi:hypothetical protein